MFLRWILVFFSSLRCFFFAILLRRFLMTEPIRPLLLAQRQTGTPSRSPGREAGHKPEVKIRADAYRPRSAQAYLVSHSAVTAWPPTRHRRPGTPPGADGGPGGRIGQTRCPQSTCPWCCGGSGLSAVSSQRERSAGPYIGGPEVLVDRLLRNPE